MTLAAQTALLAERQACHAAIDAAYWLFVHTARGQPPALVVPEAYTRLAQIARLLLDARHEEREQA